MRTPAPIDVFNLKATLSTDIMAARTLPGEAYTSPEVFEWERRHLFEGGWLNVGRTGDLPDSGDQKAVPIGDKSVLLVRDVSGELKAYFNTCPHRGHEFLPVDECANSRMIRCPYHSWSFDHDGNLKTALGLTTNPEFDTATHGLIPVRAAEWHGWMFLNLSGDAPELGAWVGELDSFLDTWQPERLVERARHEYVIQANWKIVIENFRECYHCPSIHPELSRVSPPNNGRRFDRMSLVRRGGATSGLPSVGNGMTLAPFAETMSISGSSTAMRIEGVGDEHARTIYYFTLMSNMLVSPHPDYVMVHRMVPLSHAETYVECYWLFDPTAAEQPDFDPAFAEEFWDVTNKQDWKACESTYRGMLSGGYRPGPFAPHEVSVWGFQAAIAESYLEGALPLPRAVA
jgi:Rieske 2Fe-2S family protein